MAFSTIETGIATTVGGSSIDEFNIRARDSVKALLAVM